jgi:hypothetical protein
MAISFGFKSIDYTRLLRTAVDLRTPAVAQLHRNV